MEKMAMSVKELALTLGISLPVAYELVKQPEFPVIHVGARILIPVDEFQEWIVTNSNN